MGDETARRSSRTRPSAKRVTARGSSRTRLVLFRPVMRLLTAAPLALLLACTRVDPTYTSGAGGGTSSGGGTGGGGLRDSGVGDGGAVAIAGTPSRLRVASDGAVVGIASGGTAILAADPARGLEGELATGLVGAVDYALLGGTSARLWTVETGTSQSGPALRGFQAGRAAGQVPLPGRPAAIAADAEGAYVVTTDSDGRAVLRATVDGTVFRELAAVAGGAPLPFAALDSGFVYWGATVGGQDFLYRSSATLAAGAPEVLALVDGGVAEVSAAAGDLFVLTDAAAVLRYPLDGAAPVTIFAKEAGARSLVATGAGVALVADAGVFRSKGPGDRQVFPEVVPATGVRGFTATATRLFVLGGDGVLRTFDR